ncbi:hypothetical protein HPP92_007188 [Vanilla planifolia]|uniref:Uncharacterized protein n=1 Tax=Vanilla planifolia TaxID=51239 RepID=A0A835RDL7_VANPL|nr:hypothetical protein HPP92_007188 [Vanilla planifolia]
MATGWMKSLHCKLNAIEDVHLPRSTSAKKPTAPALSCSNSTQTLRDIVYLIHQKRPPIPKKSRSTSSPAEDPQQNPSQNNAGTPMPSRISQPNPKPSPKKKTSNMSSSPPPPPASLPTLTDLPVGHSSRTVIEKIFGSSWSRRGAPFPGEIEMLFRVHQPPRAVAAFEERRTAVQSLRNNSRCTADGNEMMRFHSSAASASAIYNAGVSRCVVGEKEGVLTFAGSGGAHKNTGGGLGRHAMLICRVIVGRVRDSTGDYAEADSVSLGEDELLVFDSRSVLPCFLIIYKI